MARLFVWGPNAPLHTVVTKNWGGHSMVSTAVAFVLFAGAMFPTPK